MAKKLIEISQIDIVNFDFDKHLKSGKISYEELKRLITVKLKSMNSIKSLYNTIVIDKNDKLFRIQSNSNGYKNIVDRFTKQLMVVTGMPLIILSNKKC